MNWDEVKERINRWVEYPEEHEDDGIEPVSKSIADIALEVVEFLIQEGKQPPDMTVADPNGGVCLEYRQKNKAEYFHIWDDGTVEVMYFIDTKLVGRWDYKFYKNRE